jgi:UDPglucose 6-dehydrogenase
MRKPTGAMQELTVESLRGAGFSCILFMAIDKEALIYSEGCEAMKVAVVGAGYVGLVTGVCLAEMGNRVWCVDIDENKIDDLMACRVSIFEPGLDEMVSKNHRCGRLFFTTDISEALEDCKVCLIAVGTPMGEDGGAELSHVMSVAEEIGRKMTDYICVVDKSTVPVGTAA